MFHAIVAAVFVIAIWEYAIYKWEQHKERKRQKALELLAKYHFDVGAGIDEVPNHRKVSKKWSAGTVIALGLALLTAFRYLFGGG